MLGLGLGIATLRGRAAAFDPAALGMDWWEPSRGYTGTPAAVTGLPNQREGGPALTYAGTQPATYADGAVNFPNAQNDQRLISNGLAAQIGTGANADFTLGFVVEVYAGAPNPSLWSAASISTSTPTRMFALLNLGLLRLFAYDADNVQAVYTTNVAFAPGSGRQAVLISAHSDGTVSCWHNGVLVDDRAAWSRPALVDLDQWTIGATAQGASILSETQGAYGSIIWGGNAVSDADGHALAQYLWSAAA